MNEIMISENKTNYPKFKNKLIPIIFIIFIIKNLKSVNLSVNKVINQKMILDNFVNLKPKIHLLKKIGPYLPQSQVSLLNKIIVLFEKINKIVNLIELLSNDYDYEPIVVNNAINKKERFTGIIKVLENELPKDISKTLRPLIEIATNFDQYKEIFSSLINLLGSSADSKFNLEDLLGSFSSMLGDKNDNNLKDMAKMLEIVKVLNSPTSKEEQSQ